MNHQIRVRQISIYNLFFIFRLCSSHMLAGDAAPPPAGLDHSPTQSLSKSPVGPFTGSRTSFVDAFCLWHQHSPCLVLLFCSFTLAAMSPNPHWRVCVYAFVPPQAWQLVSIPDGAHISTNTLWQPCQHNSAHSFCNKRCQTGFS